MISARVLPSCRPRKAQQRARAHQEGVPGWGWTRFKMGSSGSCLWGQAHRALFTFLWRRRVESEGRLDKWFLASRTTIVRLFKRMMAVWLCRGVSVSVCFSPPLRVSLWRHWGDPRARGGRSRGISFFSSLPFPFSISPPALGRVSRNGCISSLLQLQPQ